MKISKVLKLFYFDVAKNSANGDSIEISLSAPSPSPNTSICTYFMYVNCHCKAGPTSMPSHKI